jgi:hypothetical protein
LRTRRETKQTPNCSEASHSLTEQETSSPLEAMPYRERVNFSVFSKHATDIELLLVDHVGDGARAA